MKRRVEIEVIVNSLRFRFGMSLAFGLIGTDIALARGPLFPGPLYPVDAGPISVATGDLDGDQRLDLVVANGETFAQIYTVSILLGIGDGTFAGAVDYAADVGPASVLRWSSRLVIFAFQGDPYPFGCSDDPCRNNIVNPCR